MENCMLVGKKTFCCRGLLLLLSKADADVLRVRLLQESVFVQADCDLKFSGQMNKTNFNSSISLSPQNV